MMEDMVVRSKMHKAERQAKRMEDDEFVDELDKGVNDVMSLLFEEAEQAEKVSRR